MRSVTARVGLACSRSIWLSMERLTPLALASASSDQPRARAQVFHPAAQVLVDGVRRRRLGGRAC